MPQYSYKCQNKECTKEFDSIEKISTKFAYCPYCKNIGIRMGIELCNPAHLVAGIGGFHKPSYRERQVE